MLRYKAPLNWPESIPATPRIQQRSDSGFAPNISLKEALAFLEQEIKDANIGDAVLYIDIVQPNIERLAEKVGNHSGACIHLKYNGQGYIITCDRWQKLEHNLYALHLIFRQWRSMEQWGLGSLPMLMAGFEADRAPREVDISAQALECLKTFGLGDTATLEDAVAIYHRRAKALANDNAELTKLNLAMDELRDHFAAKSETL